MRTATLRPMRIGFGTETHLGTVRYRDPETRDMVAEPLCGRAGGRFGGHPHILPEGTAITCEGCAAAAQRRSREASHA
jgi:hypothetical protein